MLITAPTHTWRSYLPVLFLLPLLFVEPKLAAGLLLVCVFGFGFFLASRNADSVLVQAVFVALVLRTFLVFANEYFTFLPLQPDALHYSAQAMKILDNQARNLPIYYDIPYSLSVKSYSLFLSVFYGLLGEMPLVARVVNVLLGIMSGVMVYKISLLVFESRRTARIALLFALFLPSIIAFTSYVLRDTLVLYLTLNMIYFTLRAQQSKRLRHVLLAGLFFALVGIIRIQNLYLYTLFYLLYFAWMVLKSPKNRRLKFSILTFLIIGMAVVFVVYQDFIVGVITYPLRAQPLRAEGGSAYLVNMQYNSLLDVIIYSPIRFVYFTFGPFLWNVGGAFQLLTALEGIIVFAAFLFTIQYFRRHRMPQHQHWQLFLILFCMLGLLANAMVDSNFGTAVRHRMNYILFFFMFAAAYFRNIKIKVL